MSDEHGLLLMLRLGDSLRAHGLDGSDKESRAVGDYIDALAADLATARKERDEALAEANEMNELRKHVTREWNAREKEHGEWVLRHSKREHEMREERDEARAKADDYFERQSKMAAMYAESAQKLDAARTEAARLREALTAIMARHDAGTCYCGGCSIARAALAVPVTDPGTGE